MGLFNKKDDTASAPLRSVHDTIADESVGDDCVVVLDIQRHGYERRGYTLVEDLSGDMCLMRKPKAKE